MKIQKLNERGEGLISGLIALVFGTIITLVALRFVFGIFNISAFSGFIGWVYDVTDPLVWPFFSVLGREVPALAGSFEFATLLALIVYGLIGGLLIRLFSGLKV